MLILNIQVSSNLILPVKSYEPEKMFPYFGKKGKIPPKSHRFLMEIPPSDSAYQENYAAGFQALICTIVEFCIFFFL